MYPLGLQNSCRMYIWIVMIFWLKRRWRIRAVGSASCSWIQCALTYCQYRSENKAERELAPLGSRGSCSWNPFSSAVGGCSGKLGFVRWSLTASSFPGTGQDECGS